MNNLTLVVNAIIGADVKGMSRVTVAYDVFNAVRGVNPLYPCIKGQDAAKNLIYSFDFDGVKLYSHYDRESRNTIFLMDTEQARKHLVQQEVRAKFNFDANLFDRTVIATA